MKKLSKVIKIFLIAEVSVLNASLVFSNIDQLM